MNIIANNNAYKLVCNLDGYSIVKREDQRYTAVCRNGKWVILNKIA